MGKVCCGSHPDLKLSDNALRTLFGTGGEAGQSKTGIVASINPAHRSSEELIYVRLAVLSRAEDAVDFNVLDSYLEVKSSNLSCIESDSLVPQVITFTVQIDLKVNVLDHIVIKLCSQNISVTVVFGCK